jgi:hypothetical protein
VKRLLFVGCQLGSFFAKGLPVVACRFGVCHLWAVRLTRDKRARSKRARTFLWVEYAVRERGHFFGLGKGTRTLL